jgi:hypothetical protein
VPTVDSPVLNWQHKIRHMRHYLRGWARDLSGKYKLERDILNNISLIIWIRRLKL